MNGPGLSFGELVVDTSVVVKFLVGENDSDKAEALYRRFFRGEVRLASLDLLFIESLNALWVKTRRRELSEPEAEVKIRTLLSLGERMRIVPAASLSRQAYRWSCDLAHSPHATSFLALAQSRGVPLLTADGGLWRKARQRAKVLLLRDFVP